MKKLIFTILFTMLSTISLADKHHDKAYEYWAKANELDKSGQYRKAGEMYANAAKEFQSSDKPQLSNICVALGRAGLMNIYIGQYDIALEYSRQALAIAEDTADKDSISSISNNIGLIYYNQGQYDQAIKYYSQAMSTDIEQGNQQKIAVYLNNIGMIYYIQGQYDKAIKNFQEALELDTKLGNLNSVGTYLNNIGLIYYNWGKYDQAIEFYNKGLDIDKKLKNENGIALRLSNIGQVYYAWHKYKKALQYYTEALNIFEKMDNQIGVATNLNNIGRIYYHWGQYDKAIENINKALKIAEKLKVKNSIATYLNNIGQINEILKHYDKALEYYKKALTINEELGNKVGKADNLNNIGAMYYVTGSFKKALIYLKQSIALKEELRLTVQGDIRRNYLESQLYTYHWLIRAYLADKNPQQCFNIIELSRAKYLVEKMGERFGENGIEFSGIEAYQKTLDSDTAVLCYANVNWTNIALIVVTKEMIKAIEVNNDYFIELVEKKFKREIDNSLAELRGGNRIMTTENTSNITRPKQITVQSIENIINDYRKLLSRHKLSAQEKLRMDTLAKELYKFLVQPIENVIKGKKNLIIIPDGILCFLPFESLQTKEDKYLVEDYYVKYCQSLTVAEIIKKRNYPDNRKPLLAFGGAVYTGANSHEVITPKDFDISYRYLSKLLSQGRGQEAYNLLGMSTWSNLPGTLKEVNEIISIVKGAEAIRGKDVIESKVKDLSKTGKLKNYKVIHFATHGIAVPDFPEFSALVLSQIKDVNEDNYLTMKEILNLDIEADLVNLSACQTGLGKIFGGEGVVGLTQSFLIAGANGLLVSLWSVADDTTKQFMVGVYKLLVDKGISYDAAVTIMKRRFIRDTKLALPFFWSPFVYYGQ